MHLRVESAARVPQDPQRTTRGPNMPKKPVDGLYSKLHLRVTARTQLGQTVFVTGSSSGDRALEGRGEALEMVTSPGEWPVWRTKKPVIVARGVPHCYEYQLRSGDDVDGESSLADAAGRVVTPDVAELELNDVFGTFERFGPGDRTSSFASSRYDSRGELAGRSRLHIVCYHLPVRVWKDDEGQWRAGWGDSLIARSPGEGQSVADAVETWWLGTVHGGLNRRKLTFADETAIRRVLEPMHCIPIFSVHSKDAYLNYCKKVLWPSFHNVTVLDQSCACWQDPSNPSTTWDQEADGAGWDAYEALNLDFRDALLERLDEGDTVWVHDYHLMLLPSLLASSAMFKQDAFTKRKARIVFFLHIPFPTSQLFCSIAHGSRLLNGIVGADVVGFHAFDHARHFLNACKRLMGMPHKSVQGGVTGVEYEGRTVMVVVRHVSVEPGKILRALEGDATLREIEALDLTLQPLMAKKPKVVLAGVDSCQRLSGVALKLLAFERFLSEYPQWRGRVVLVQYALLDGTRVEDEARTSGELRKLAARINGQCAGAVEYREMPSSRLTLPVRLALWSRADALIGTAIREGHNLAPFEYALVREKNPGVTLASEFSATASLMSGALTINPFDPPSVASALDAALCMSAQERRDRLDRDLPYVKSRPSGQWTKEILHDMNVVHQQKRVYGDGGEDLVAPLDHGALKSAYAKAERRLLLLDFGGTLVPRGDYITKVLKTQQIGVTTLDLLDERAAKALEALSNDPRTTVYVVSGATMHALHALLGCYPKLGLAAANGLCTTKPSLKTYETTRRCGVADYGTDWDAVKAAALPILRRHAARTNGSSVLSRDPGVAWSYYRADPEWGRIQAVQLIGDLEAVLKPYDVSVVHLDGMIEVVPGRMHKGNVVKHILNTLDEPPDFLFACGDSKTDEKMFSSVYSHLADAPTAERNQAYTVTVGKKASRALFYLNDHAHVIDALAKLASACEPAS